jgi:hypothetical protein
MSDELLGNSDKLDKLELECKCVNCFRDVVCDYGYAMDMLICYNCHNAYLDGNLDTNRLSFIKHGNWKIENLQSELAEKDKELIHANKRVEYLINDGNQIVEQWKIQNKKLHDNYHEIVSLKEQLKQKEKELENRRDIIFRYQDQTLELLVRLEQKEQAIKDASDLFLFMCGCCGDIESSNMMLNWLEKFGAKQCSISQKN